MAGEIITQQRVDNFGAIRKLFLGFGIGRQNGNPCRLCRQNTNSAYGKELICCLSLGEIGTSGRKNKKGGNDPTDKKSMNMFHWSIPYNKEATMAHS